MNELTGWAAVGMAAVSNMTAWLVILKLKRNNSNSKGSNPGTAKECIDRGKKLVEIETEQTHFKENIQEIKGDIKEIKTAVISK